MAKRAYRLHMAAPLHVGDVGVGKEETLAYLPSDSLFSALAVTWGEMPAHAHVLKALGTEFAVAPPLLITSAFPFAGDVLLLPKPRLAFHPRTDANSAKTFKRVRWISTTIFRALTGGLSQAAFDRLWAERALLQSDTVWITANERDALAHALEPSEDGKLSLWDSMRAPHVTVDRIRNAGTLFHVGRVHFAARCGLWLLAQGEDDWLNRTEDALQLLADSGIGGQRSRGNGQFRWEATSDPLAGSAPEPSDYCLLLSRLAPTVEQMPRLRQAASNYQLITVGGFNGTPGDNPVIRKQVRMLAEGSLIAQGAQAPGRLVDVTPDKVSVGHRIYRYGYGYTVPVRVADKEDGAWS